MTQAPYYEDPFVTLHQGDVREVLRSLPAESVQTCVTSPPYWSLRDYGIPPSVWGGADWCQHPDLLEDEAHPQRLRNGAEGGLHEGRETNTLPVNTDLPRGGTCMACGAWRGALGLEPTPDLFVAHIVEVFREVRRVLRKDGTCWVNLGDSYASSPSGSFGGGGRPGDGGAFRSNKAFNTASVSGLKPKDLVGIPWMVAFALRADGWYLRQDIIWAKPNPMPESVRDRCTKAHEYLFLLSKSGRYHYDADAIREAAEYGYREHSERWVSGTENGDGHRSGGGSVTGGDPTAGRNKRSVWSIPTAPFPEAHFATFPPDLVRPCVLAGSRGGGTVLDPFVGSGTTAMVAKKWGRKAIGIDLNPEYLAMAANRIATVTLPMLDLLEANRGNLL